jgi:hypothetical protein
LDVSHVVKGYPPPLIRSKRRLLAAATFTASAADPLTILHLGAEQLDDGTMSPAMMLECHGSLALRVEHLRAPDDWLEFEYSTHWPHKVYDREREIGTYVEKWICRSIYSMSRQPAMPLRTPPAREGFWGPFEAMVCAEHWKQVHGH